MLTLLHAERSGRQLPAVAAAMLSVWQTAGHRIEPPREPEPAGWQSVYLI